MNKELDQKRITQLQEELNKARSELHVLYEISNATRTSLKLNDVLYIILTGVTAHVGLGFNRAMLLLLNTRRTTFEGTMGIGPHTGEEANKIWTQIENERISLESLITNYQTSDTMKDSKFNHLVLKLRIPKNEKKGGVVARAISEKTPIHVKKDIIAQYKHDPLLSKIDMEEFAVVPLKTKNKTIGAIVVDNPFNNKAITEDDIRMLTMFANQAALAIENSQLYEETVLQSQINSLTKLWNHGYFQSKLKEEIKKSKGNDTCLSLVMLDLDNFKELNDTLGHQIGDRVLKDTARIIKEYCRKLDYPCRYGGEEFAIILPQTDKKQAHVIAERIRQAIEKSEFYYKEQLIEKKISISIGVACFPEKAINDKAELLSSADKALYEAKHTGKNKTCIFCL